MPTDFWAGWIVLLTVLSLIGLAWMTYSAYFSRQGDAPHEEADTVWDENLREGANPPPMWWFWFMLAALVFTMVYLMLYPGLGSFAGAYKWSQGGELDTRIENFEAEFSSKRGSIMAMDFDDLQQDELVMRAASRVYSRHCAACHGVHAQGQANAFPNLRDELWQWGNSPEAIERSIREGRQGIMVGWANSLTRAEASSLAQYTVALAANKPSTHPGRIKFEQLCASCHGADGTGQSSLGAPDLTKGRYTYGGDTLTIKHTILHGRHGVMPAFGNILDDMQIRILVAWLMKSP